MKKIWKFIKEWLGIIANVITVLLFFWGERKYALYFGLFGLSWIGLYFFHVVYSLFSTNRAERRLKTKYYNTWAETSRKLHKYHHRLRDYTSSTDAKRGMSLKSLNKTCELLCHSLCDLFEEYGKNILRDEYHISVCIKVIKTDSISDMNYMNWKLETIGRSPSTDQERLSIDRETVWIKDNSDFQIIVSEEFKDRFIAFKDMRNIKEDFLKTYKVEYKNSREDFIKYYRSCIIVPIMIDGENISKEIADTIPNIQRKYLLLGFLCVDSMKVFESDEEQEVFNTMIEIAKAMGDSLYVFFEKVLLSMINQQVKIDGEGGVK